MTLKRKEMLLISFMLFSLFFGAGNLIFPPFLGQSAGNQSIVALLGFLITAVILPVLGVVVVAQFDGLDLLARKAGKTFALILITAILFCFGISASAETGAQATLYNYYGDNMLFKQNDDAIFAGTAAAGSEIICTLTNSSGETIAVANTVASADNTFSLSFKAPAGSFEEYTATLTVNGEVFDELTGVVFGELWLAGGQSNMQWILISTAEGYDMAVNGKVGSSAIRMMYAPHPGTYKGSNEKCPAQPLTDYEATAHWYKGNDASIFGMTAIGYFFAEKMLSDLNVPIGILDANLGGTSILTWLPREAIENNAQVLADCNSDGRYIPLKNWNEDAINWGIDMTSNYNKVIHPLSNFRLSGML